jgi:hypothetical protein
MQLISSMARPGAGNPARGPPRSIWLQDIRPVLMRRQVVPPRVGYPAIGRVDPQGIRHAGLVQEYVSQSAPKWRTPCAFAALINCGFPEPEQCRTALDIAQAFAARAGLDWAGGLALGEGGAIDGGPLERLGGLTRHVRAALDLAAAALAEGHPVPPAAIARLARLMMPARLYTLMGNIG